MNAHALRAAVEARAVKVASTDPPAASRLRACAARLSGEAPEAGDAAYDGIATTLANWVAASGAVQGISVHGDVREGATICAGLIAELDLRTA